MDGAGRLIRPTRAVRAGSGDGVPVWVIARRRSEPRAYRLRACHAVDGRGAARWAGPRGATQSQKHSEGRRPLTPASHPDGAGAVAWALHAGKLGASRAAYAVLSVPRTMSTQPPPPPWSFAGPSE